MRLGFDIDGVFANFESRFCRLLPPPRDPELKGVWPVYRDDFPKTWDWPEAYGCTPAEVSAAWRAIRHSDDFWKTLLPHRGAEKALYALSAARLNHDVYFITQRSLGINSKQQTEQWLAYYGYPVPTVLMTGDKAGAARVLKLDAYIDDKPDTLVQDFGETRLFIQDRPYNRTLPGETRGERVENVNQMLVRLHV